MGDSAVPAGRLVFWTPSAPASAWADDPRAPALVHEHHVRAAAARGPRHVDPAWVGVSFGVGRAGPDRVASAFSAWLRGYEHLRSKLVPAPDRCVRRTLPASAVTLRRQDVGVFADGASVRRQIEAFFDRSVSPLGWPQVAFATVEDAAGVTVFAGADHGVVDGYTLAMIPGQIRGRLAGRAEDVPGPTFLDFGAEERSLAHRLPAGPERADHWRTLLRGAHGQTPAFPLPLGASEAPHTQCSTYRRLLDGPAAARFAATSRAGGGTTAAGLLACLALAAAEVAGERHLSVVNLANTRPDRWRTAPGWFVGLHPVRIPAAAGAGFADTIAFAAAELRRHRPGPGSSLPHISRMLRREIHPRFVVSYLDVRRVPGAPPQQEDVMLRSRIHGPAEVYVWLTRSDRGVHLSARFPDTAVARANVGRFVVAAAHAAARVADGHRADAVPMPA
ncbi:condensation domain-containing protein [Streptomyces klenkii]|uniref:condensation domain-containing protein n=1 Tax=Streptomyces klenkii TaxID=1420899 RepID=UPI0036EAECB8